MHTNNKVSKVQHTPLLCVCEIPDLTQLGIRQLGLEEHILHLISTKYTVRRADHGENSHESGLIFRTDERHGGGVSCAGRHKTVLVHWRLTRDVYCLLIHTFTTLGSCRQAHSYCKRIEGQKAIVSTVGYGPNLAKRKRR